MDMVGFSGYRLRPGPNYVGRALALSVAIHLALFGALDLGRRLHLHLPEWLKSVLNFRVQAAQLKPPSAAEQQEPTLTFVEVDPSLATPEAPKDTHHYSAFNAEASNPDISAEEKVKMDGAQDKVPKVVDTLHPAPAPPATPMLPEPKPVEIPREKPPATAPGDLALAKPAEKETKEEEKPRRPRTLVEAQTQKGLIPGQKMKQDGGVRRHGQVSLDAKATPFGAYDAAMIDAIARRWYAILDSTPTPTRPGKVVIQFRQFSDGRVTDLKVIESEVGELLAFYCQKAITDPSPFEKWPPDMRRSSAREFRDIIFTFYYEF